jgi:membrane-associated phospholipid phosphatase
MIVIGKKTKQKTHLIKKRIQQKWIIILIFFLSGTLVNGQNADISLLRDINHHRIEGSDPFFEGVTNSTSIVGFSIPTLITGYGLIKHDTITLDKGIEIGTALLVSGAVTLILKKLVNRPRPFTTYPDIEKLTSGGSGSFPSGHTSMAFATATSLSLVYPKWYVIAPSFLWASTVAYSRMDLGVHYPSDILGGVVVGTLSAYLSHKINLALTRRYVNKWYR